MTASRIWVYSDPELEEEEGETAAESAPPYCSPTAAAYRSVCTSSTAARYQAQYNVPPEFGLSAPRAKQRANAPPPGYAAVYIHQFQCGLKLPLQPFVASVLAHHGIALAQLHPNGIFFILGFLGICIKASVVPSPALFQHFFGVQRIGPGTKGWFTFYPIRTSIVPGQPTSVKNWKRSFLFFKTAPITENLNLSWNDFPVMDPPAVDIDRPSEQTINRLLAYVRSSSKHKHQQEEGKMNEADARTDFAPKSCSSKNGKMRAVSENEDGMISRSKAMNVTVEPNTTSTESLSTACRQEKLKRMADFDANKPAKTLRGETGSSQVPLVASLKDLSPEDFACVIQKSVCSYNLQLQGDKEELEKTVDLLKTELSMLQGVREHDLKDSLSKIASLQGYTEELEKENASLKAEVSRLKSGSDDHGPLLDVVEKVMAAMEQEAKDKNEEIGSLKSQLKSAVDAQSRLKSLVDDRGPLLRVYTQKLLETRAFAFKFTLLDHLLSLPEIPASSQLKHLEVDEDQDWMISLPPLHVKLEEPAMG